MAITIRDNDSFMKFLEEERGDDSLEEYLKKKIDDPEYGGRSPCCRALIDVDVDVYEEDGEEVESIRYTCSCCGKNLIEGEVIPAWYLLEEF